MLTTVFVILVDLSHHLTAAGVLIAQFFAVVGNTTSCDPLCGRAEDTKHAAELGRSRRAAFLSLVTLDCQLYPRRTAA